MTMRKPDFGSMVLIIAFAIVITVVVYLAAVNVINTFVVGSTSVPLYSRPTWPDPTPVPTTESTEETEVTEETLGDEDAEE